MHLYDSWKHVLNRRLFLCSVFLSLPFAAFSQPRVDPNVKQETLSGCAGETAPFVITKDVPTVTGYSIEVFNRVAKQWGRNPNFQELPWARCLEAVKLGQIDLAIDAYDDSERRKLFLYSLPYHTLTPQVFYRAADGEKIGLPSKTVKALESLRGCGVHEYTYEHYGLDTTKLDRGSPNDQSMLSKLSAGRCEFALEELEYIIGARRTRSDWPSESGLSSFKPLWAKAPQVHFLIGIAHPNAQALQAQVNLSIATADKEGFLKALRKKYF